MLNNLWWMNQTDHPDTQLLLECYDEPDAIYEVVELCKLLMLRYFEKKYLAHRNISGMNCLVYEANGNHINLKISNYLSMTECGRFKKMKT